MAFVPGAGFSTGVTGGGSDRWPVSASGGVSGAPYSASAANFQAVKGIVPQTNADQGDPNLGSTLGVGSPIGVVTPTKVGQQYQDTASDHIYVANGTASSQNWTQVK